MRKLLFLSSVVFMMVLLFLLKQCYGGGSISIFIQGLSTTQSSQSSSSSLLIGGTALGWIGGGYTNWQQSGTASAGLDINSFKGLSSVFVDANDDIYVADCYFNHRISKWDMDGNAFGWIGGGSDGWKTSNVTTTNSGRDYQSFWWPSDIFITNNTLYIVDNDNNRISKWDIGGTALGWCGSGSDGWQLGTVGNNSGIKVNSLHNPDSIWIEGSSIYVTDRYNHRICKWDIGGTALGWIGGGSDGWKISDCQLSGQEAGQDYQSFHVPRSITIDGTLMYIADTYNNRVCRWHIDGTAMGWIGGGGNDGWQYGLTTTNSSELNGMNSPNDVLVDADGNLLISDTFNHRLSKWTVEGFALGWIGGGSNGWKITVGADLGGDYQSFDVLVGFHIDLPNNILIADSKNNRVARWINN